MVTDDAAALGHPVVVDEHGGRTDVGLFADRRVAHIGEVGHLRAGADLAGLELDVGADVDVVVQDRTGA
jgi:hypothetical protein